MTFRRSLGKLRDITGIFTAFGKLEVRELNFAGQRAVVLWSGLLFDHRQHLPLGERLAQAGFRVLLIDPPGFGESESPLRRFSMEECGAAFLQVLDGVGVQRAILGGTSWGGISAVRAAAQVPERVQALVLINTPFGKTSDGFSVIPLLARWLPLAMFAKGAAPSMLGKTTLRERPEVLDVFRSGVVASSHRAIATACQSVLERRPALWDVLPGIRVPALVIAGDEDPGYSVESMKKAADLLPRGTLEVVRGTGHASALEDPETTANAIVSFLRPIQSSV